MKDRNYLINKYNATCTENPKGSDELETYEYWLERQLLSRIETIETLEDKLNNVDLATVSYPTCPKCGSESYKYIDVLRCTNAICNHTWQDGN